MNLSNLFSRMTLLLLALCYTCPSFAWNWVGHELVAQIAYDQLTPAQKIYWEKRIEAIRGVYPKENFIRASTLPDDLKRRGNNAFNSWHFIDIPIFMGGRYSVHANSQNLLWAINKSLQVVINPKSTAFEKGFYASFLVHFIGDAHQPLHCAELYSRHFPYGDRGGNLFLILDRRWHNLHTYWDNGAGFLAWPLVKNNHSLRLSAQVLEIKYPKTYFGHRVYIINPKIWIDESHTLAKIYAYQLMEYTTPSIKYQRVAQKITQEQIVLAGYRLGEVLKSIS